MTDVEGLELRRRKLLRDLERVEYRIQTLKGRPAVLGGIPEKICANEKCDKKFTVQEGRATQARVRTFGVLYCSAKCAKAQASRQWRRRQKNQPL